MAKLVYTPRALQDLADIHHFIAHENPTAEVKLAGNLVQSCETLASGQS